MGRVGVGLVGCGLFGESHLQAYRAVPDAAVRAVFDPDRGRADRLVAEFDVPRVCASLDELCGLPDIDLVDVVTPEAAHAGPALTALARGKHVFVEKPLASVLRTCRRQGRSILDVLVELLGRGPGHVIRLRTRLHATPLHREGDRS